MSDINIALFEELFQNSPEIKYPKEGEVVNWVVVKIEKKNILVNVNNQFSGLVISKEIGNTVDLTEKLFNEIAPKYEGRVGGYTTMLKLGPRKGDNAEMVILKLV